MEMREGFHLLRKLGAPETLRDKVGLVASYGLCAAAVVALLLHSAWPDLVTAGIIGTIIGLITVASGSRPRLSAASEAISAMVATAIAIIVSAYIVPLAVKSVILGSLIVLMPGMALTTAVREISSQHLVAGVARMGGAIATLLKLTFGTVAASQLCEAFGITPRDYALPPLPAWTDWPTLLLGAFSFAILFRAARRDWLVVMGAVILGYLATTWGGRISGSLPGAPFGVFVGGLLLGSLSNIYARYAQKPGRWSASRASSCSCLDRSVSAACPTCWTAMPRWAWIPGCSASRSSCRWLPGYCSAICWWHPAARFESWQ